VSRAEAANNQRVDAPFPYRRIQSYHYMLGARFGLLDFSANATYWQNLLAEMGGEGVLRGLDHLAKPVSY